IAYGLVIVSLWIGTAIRDGSIFRRPSPQAKKELAAARDKLWNLAKEPLPGFKHAFFTTPAGVKLHYIISTTPVPPTANLVVFFHGFPDSYTLWLPVLRSAPSENTVYIALDLPGYGGSASLPSYTPYNVLEALSAFMLAMRDAHTGTGTELESPLDRGRVILVSHDWGAALACRLASEAPLLADHYIITSIMVPSAVQANITTRLASAKQQLHTWSQNPSYLRLLRSAFATLAPIGKQIIRSGYVFAFTLPAPLPSWVSKVGDNWIQRHIHGLASQNMGVQIAAADALARSAGPGVEQCLSSDYKDGLTYHMSVYQRALDGDDGWSHKISYYRNGLAMGRWEKSLETIVALSELETLPPLGGRRRSSSGVGLFEEGPKGQLKARSTIVVGKQDKAFELKLGFEGIGDFLVRGSCVVIVDGSGHWLMLEREGLEVMVKAVEWAVGGE
ncbi:alpha/beta-hydrolase, partial [Saccharata proteae CBS 121410]